MLIALALLAAQDSGAAPVRFGARVEPDTVTVGLPFQVVVRVRAPRGARITYPDGPDTTRAAAGAVQALDPRVVLPRPDTTAVELTAVYRLAAWDIGRQPLHLANVVVQEPAAGARGGTVQGTIPLSDLSVVVRAVAPRDSALRIPRPARGYLAAGPPWWLRWLWLLALLAAAAAAWWLWSRRRRTSTVQAIDPLAAAEEAFERLNRLGLLEAGERGRYVALATEVVREYLARRIAGASTALTTTELLAALAADDRVPRQQLRAVLSESDLVKFARHRVSTDQARELATTARGVVRDVDGAARAARAAAATAAATTATPRRERAA